MKINAKIEVHPLSTQINVFITNYDIKSYKIYNPISECGLNYDIFIITSILGEKMKYTGATVLSRADLVEIGPNITFSFSTDIANEYMISSPIEHNIEYRVNCINDGVIVSNKAIISADIIQEKVTYKTSLFLPEERFEGYSPNLVGIKQSGYKFIGTNNQSLINETLIALSKLSDTLNIMTSLNGEKKLVNYYHKFICHSNDGDIYYDYIQNMYSNSLNYIQNDLEVSFNGNRCKKGTYAYVYSASPIKILYLCDTYIKSQTLPDINKPYDTKLGTIIHEITHKVSKGEIQDYTYGVQLCLTNIEAKSCDDTLKCFVQEGGIFKPGSNCSTSGSNPNTNVYNADCIEFLAESVYYDHYIGTNEAETSWYNYYTIASGMIMGIVGVAAYYFFQEQH